MKLLSILLLPFFLYANQTDFLPAFEQYVTKAQKEWKVPGLAIAIVKDDKIIFAKGFGLRDLKTEKRVNKKTLFQIGSITKSFTASLIAMLVDEKKFNWNSIVSNHLPDFTLHDPWVTRNFQVADLLSQSTGLREETGTMQMVLGYPPEKIIYNLRYTPPTSSFRTTYGYQNSLYIAAGALVERVTKSSFADLLNEKIFKPLNMKDSSTCHNSYLESPNHSSFYLLNQGELYEIAKDSFFAICPCAYIPAGGIHSNVEDLAKWLIFQIHSGNWKGNTLISEDSIKKMRRCKVFSRDFGERDSYSTLGFLRADYSPYPYFWHNGETCGTKNSMAFIPEEKIGIVILSNTRGTLLPESLVWKFFDIYFSKEEIDWSARFLQNKKIEQIPPKALPAFSAMPLKNYAGTYTSDVYGDVTIAVEDDYLLLTIGPNETQMKLYPWDRDVFLLDWPGVTKNTKVAFHMGEKGVIDSMLIELLYRDSGTTFKKKEEEKNQFFGFL